MPFQWLSWFGGEELDHNSFSKSENRTGLPLPRYEILDFMQGTAVVEQAIRPGQRGRVWFQASSWPALCEDGLEILPGEAVDVLGLFDMALVVEPAFLLQVALAKLTAIQEACQHYGRSLTDPRWLEYLHGSLPNDLNHLSSSELMAAWQRFIQGKSVPIHIFRHFCRILNLDWKTLCDRPAPPPDPTSAPTPLQPSADFVGRTDAIADLHTLSRDGARAILIQGRGGMGKTTLARQFLAHGPFDRVLECWMSRETAHLTPAESLVQEWLQRDLQLSPGQQFGVSLERLRQYLQTHRVGILIDNLESALDRYGCLIASHRQYAELFALLADPTVQSVTLMTSREPLHEASVPYSLYRLKGLDVDAWRTFFHLNQIQPQDTVLHAMHQAYGGNAKAMRIISSAIRLDFQGDSAAYWRESQQDLLLERDLNDLVNSHFDRVQCLYPEAHRLLCRLGCFGYHNIPTLPVEAVISMMWDIPAEEHRRMLRFLRDLSLVESDRQRYWLHPLIQSKALALLRSSPDWAVAHQKAAEFWTTHVAAVETPDDALEALEAYYHYLQLRQWEAAAGVIIGCRDNRWATQEPLGVSFYRLGLMKRMIEVITPVIASLPQGFALGKLHNILGDLYWLTGDLQRAIRCHEECGQVAIACQSRDLEIVSLFNVGLCQIDLGEMASALTYFNTVNAMAENTEQHKYAVGAWFCLAFLHSQLGWQQAARIYVTKVSQEYDKIKTDAWSQGYSLLFLARTYRNLGDPDRAIQLYDKACTFAEESHFTLVKARALNGLAEISRDRLDFEGAIANHLAAKRLLDHIEAKCDLAEVYYQLGLTHGKMKRIEESKISFQTALQLFEQIGAINQMRKVQQMMKRHL